MAASLTLSASTLLVRRNYGQTAAGKPRISSLSLTGINTNAGASTLLDVAEAIDGVSAYPVFDTYRKDEYFVDPGE